jgi:hypothetical protein
VRFIDVAPAPDGTAHLEVFLDPDVPIGPSGLRLLGVALAAKDAHGRSLAVDGFIAAAEDGRVDPVALGHRLNDLLDSGIVNAARLASALGEVARASLLHADAVHAVLEHAFVGDDALPPRQLHHLLQLALDLSSELGRGIVFSDARAYLDRLRRSSPSFRQGRLAKDLLALDVPDEPPGAARAVSIAALQARIERAQRWSAQLASSG